MDALNFKTSIETKTAVGLVSPLQLITKNYDYLTLYMSLHYQNQRPNPNQLTICKHTLLLHKAYNSDSMSNDWTHFNIQDMCVKFHNISNFKSGNNLLANRFTILNGKIEKLRLNDSYESFKIKCK